MECSGNDAVVCDALNKQLGGHLLTKHSENYLQELSHIGQQLGESQRKNQKLSAQLEAKEQERYDKLVLAYDDLQQKREELKSKVHCLGCKAASSSVQLRKLNKNNRKNRGKLYEAKSMLARAQITRKLLNRLHDVDDCNLNENIQIETQNTDEQNTELVELKSRVEKVKHLCAQVLSSISGLKSEIENQAQKLEVALEEKKSLLKAKCVSLTDLDQALESASQTQAALLRLECEQKKLRISVQEKKTQLAFLQKQLTDQTSMYNDLCCDYKEKKRSTSDAMTQKTKLEEAVECTKQEIRDDIRVNQDIENMMKSINKRLQEKDNGRTSCRKHRKVKC